MSSDRYFLVAQSSLTSSWNHAYNTIMRTTNDDQGRENFRRLASVDQFAAQARANSSRYQIYAHGDCDKLRC